MRDDLLDSTLRPGKTFAVPRGAKVVWDSSRRSRRSWNIVLIALCLGLGIETPVCAGDSVSGPGQSPKQTLKESVRGALNSEIEETVRALSERLNQAIRGRGNDKQDTPHASPSELNQHDQEKDSGSPGAGRRPKQNRW